MKGVMRHYVEFTPQMANFGRMVEGKTKELEIHVKSNLKKRFRLSVAKEQKSGPFKKKLKRLSSTEYLLTLTLDAPSKAGTLNEQIKLKTNLKQQAEIQIRALAWVVSRVSAQPPRLMVNKNLTTDFRGFVRINNMGEKPVKVLEAKADAPDITVTLHTVKEGEFYNVLVNIPRDHKFPPNGNSITVKTNDPEFSLIKIPIRTYNGGRRRIGRPMPRPRPRVKMHKAEPQKKAAEGNK